MSEPKTKVSKKSVEKFLKSITDEKKQKDAFTVLKLMEKVTGEKGKLWGTSIIGFGSYHYVYASGREGDWPLTGFSPRKQNLVLYIMSGLEKEKTLLKKLGPHKTGKSCLYLKSLEGIDMKVLETLIRKSLKNKSAC